MRLLQKFVATAVGNPKKKPAREKAEPTANAAKKPAAKKAKPRIKPENPDYLS
jgi:hypothetical protein